MLEKQENRITTDHPEIMLLKASFDEAVNFIFHHYEIPYARIKFEYQHDFIYSFQGTIDSALEKELERIFSIKIDCTEPWVGVLLKISIFNWGI